jgi:hypothetical protein
MSKIIGVDTANIDNISGLGTGGGGEAHVLTQPSTGAIAYGGLSLSPFPFDWATFFSDIPTYAYEVSTIEFTKLKMNNSHILALDSSGNLYHKTSYNFSSQKWGNTNYNVFEQVLTGVSGFWLAGNSTASWALAIKTDGTLWGVGYNFYGTLGLGNQTNQNSWVQIGSDTDWKDVAVSNYNAYALKGGSTDTYLYATGRNTYGATAQGTTSGYTTSFTRVKTGAATDWSENLNYSVGSFKIGGNQYGCMVINSSGELFMFGRAGSQFPAAEEASVASNSNQVYVVQLGTDTDWQQLVTGNYDTAFRKGTTGSIGLYTCGNTFGFQGASSSSYSISQYGTDTDWNAFDDTIQHGYGPSQSAARVFIKNNIVSVWGSPSNGSWNSPTTSLTGANINTLNSFPSGSTVNSVAVQVAGSTDTMLLISVS